MKHRHLIRPAAPATFICKNGWPAAGDILLACRLVLAYEQSTGLFI
ncbi:hypothetical protein [Bifidobacterium callimiconis]|nr:hypothetical protein [Bifidobacterium callimiconis]